MAGRSVRIATDSKRLAEEYRQLTRLPVEVFPIPHTRATDGGVGEDEKLQPRHPIPRLVLLGDARTVKGFPLLVAALKLLASHLEARRFEVVAQCNIVGQDKRVWEAREALERAQLCNVRLTRESLSTGEYYGLLGSADIVLIPYARNRYYACTSGILAEAFAAGKPVVTTAGTWMADQVEMSGAGVLFEDGQAQDLARAIRESVDRLTDLRQAARDHQGSWLAFHNPGVLYDMLTSDWGQE